MSEPGGATGSQATVWEYQALTVGTGQLDFLHLQLNALGSLGWEVCGFASADKTVALNALLALLKRPARPFPAPPDLVAAWKQDPSGRYRHRFWDGSFWTEHVIAEDGKTTTDWPTKELLQVVGLQATRR